LETC